MGRKRSVVAGGVAMTMMTGVGMTGAGVAQAAEDSGDVTIAEVLGCEKQTDFAPTVADQVLGGGLTIAPWNAISLTGNIDWSLDPFRHPTWETKFRSLRWVDTLVDKSVDPSVDPISQLAFKNRAQQILQDWIKDNPLNDPNPLPFTWVGASAVAQRAEGLLCDRRAFGDTDWLDRTLLDHGRFLTNNWGGSWNHGTMEALTLYRIGCITGDNDDRALGRQRMVESFEPNKLGPVLDRQGATNEQSVGYEDFQYSLWSKAIRTLEACGDKVPDVMRNRIAKIPAFLTAATQPDGTMVQIGDTYANPAAIVPGTTLEYAVTQGASGPRPTKLVSVYNAGYVFGHSGWGENRPFAKESFYSLRFGKARQVHGHDDHQSITYFAHGVPMIVDSGHDGYQDSANRDFLRSEEGHNVLTVDGVTPHKANTALEAKKIKKDWQFYKVADSAYGMERTRSVLFAQGPDISVVLDKTSATRATHTFRQLWHLAPTMKTSKGKRGVVTAVPNDGTDAKLWMIPVSLDSRKIRTSSSHVIKGQTVPRQGWVSERMLERTPAPVIERTTKGHDTQMLTVLVPTAKQSKVTTSIRGIGHGVKVLTVTIDGKAHQFRIGAGGKLSEFKPKSH